MKFFRAKRNNMKGMFNQERIWKKPSEQLSLVRFQKARVALHAFDKFGLLESTFRIQDLNL